MAHYAKYNKAACGQMLSHYDREKETITNDDVNRELSYLNYNLGPARDISQGAFIRKRCSEVRCQNRKDINVLCSWVITIPKDFLANYPEREKEFFQESYKFLEGKYGRENVISAYVHKDETTPHMHFAFVPVVPDRKRGGFKVSAKEAVTRADLQHFHQQLSAHLENRLNVPVNILNGATREGNKSIEELKRQSAEERLKEATRNASEAIKEAQNQKEVLNYQVNVKMAQIANMDVIGGIMNTSSGLHIHTARISDGFLSHREGTVVEGLTPDDVEKVFRKAKAMGTLQAAIDNISTAGAHMRLMAEKEANQIIDNARREAETMTRAAASKIDAASAVIANRKRDDVLAQKKRAELMSKTRARAAAIESQIAAAQDELQRINELCDTKLQEAAIKAEEIIFEARQRAGLAEVTAEIEDLLGIVPLKQLLDADERLQTRYEAAWKVLTPAEASAYKAMDVDGFLAAYKAAHHSGDIRVFELLKAMEHYKRCKEAPHTKVELLKDIQSRLDKSVHLRGKRLQ